MVLGLASIQNRWFARLIMAVAYCALASSASLTWAQVPSATAKARPRPTPPELTVPVNSAAIPRSVVVVSDKEKPQEALVPAVGSVRAGEPQAGTLPADSRYPQQSSAGNRYPPAAKTDRYAPPAVGQVPAVNSFGTVPGATASDQATLEPVTGQQEPSPTPSAPAEMPLPLESNRIGEAARTLPAKGARPAEASGDSRSVLSAANPVSGAPPTMPATVSDQALQPGQTAAPRTQVTAVDGNEPTPSATAESLGPASTAASESETPVAAGEPTGDMPTVAPLAEERAPAVSAPATSLGDAPLPASPQDTAAAETAAATPKPVDQIDIAPSTFRGIEPGVSTLAQVLTGWGKPAEQTGTESDQVLLYKMAPFSVVQVSTAGGVVSSVLIQLDGSQEPRALAERLQLEAIRTVEVRDEQGQPLGLAFPERGVLFSYDPAAEKPAVAQILLETIDPQAFYMRAETYWRSQSAASIDDLKYVSEQLPGDPAAPHLLAKIYLSLGQIDAALAAVDKTLETAPEENELRLTRAQCLLQLGKDQEAEQAATAVRSTEGVTTLDKGRALSLLGDLAAQGSRRDFKAAIALHMEAIKLVEPLANDPLVSTRRKAREVLLNATLAVASDVAWGNWNRKEEVVPKWIERADAYARDAITNDGAGVELRLMVIERALAAHTGFKPAVDPARFLDVAKELTGKLIESTADPLARQAADWELGRIYNHAVRLAHLRGTVEEGLKYGALAQEKLENGAAGRGSSLQARQEIGRLFFHMGVLEAVHRQDHEKAVEWYDRAHDLLVTEEGETVDDPGQLGEMFVSMGVSFWQVDLKQKGLELTVQGTRLVKQAVDQGTLPADALMVPYGNLASMHGELGHADQAREISLTAEKIQRSQLK